MERDSLVIEIMDLSKDYVCKDCGSDQWHLNVVVKPNGSGGAFIKGTNWFFDPDWEMYCPECQTQATCNNLIKRKEN